MTTTADTTAPGPAGAPGATPSAAPGVDPGVTPAAETDRLPRDPRTGDPIPPRAQPGYYPDWHALDQQAFWDAATRDVVRDRVDHVPPIRFFRVPGELAFARAVFDRLLPQDDRDPEHRISIVNYVDEILYERRIPGYRFVHMPPDQEVYRLGFQGIEAIARHLYQRGFVELDSLAQDHVLKTLHDTNPPAGQEIWQQLSVRHFWLLLLDHAIEAYYAHPYAWDEIGFGGPAYPRGYMRLLRGEPEPWESAERRYAWDPPPASLSGGFMPIGGENPLDEQLHGKVPTPGQQGTH
jgi:hypothetical protein